MFVYVLILCNPAPCGDSLTFFYLFPRGRLLILPVMLNTVLQHYTIPHPPFPLRSSLLLRALAPSSLMPSSHLSSPPVPSACFPLCLSPAGCLIHFIVSSLQVYPRRSTPAVDRLCVGVPAAEVSHAAAQSPRKLAVSVLKDIRASTCKHKILRFL